MNKKEQKIFDLITSEDKIDAIKLAKFLANKANTIFDWEDNEGNINL